MKKLVFLLFVLIISGCGGGGDRSGGAVTADLTVQPQDSLGNVTSGRSVNLEGGSIDMDCFQNPNAEPPGTVNGKCSTASGQSAQGQATTLIVFTDLPTGQVYTLTELGSTGGTAAVCHVLVDALSLTIQDGPCQETQNLFTITMTVS